MSSATYLKPMPVSISGAPSARAMRSTWNEVENVLAIPPLSPRLRKTCSSRSARTWCGDTKRPCGVEHAEPVGVAVVRDAEVEAPGAHAVGGGREVRADRLGMHAAEERVALGAERRDAQRSRPPERISATSAPAAPCIASARTDSRAARIAATSTSEARRSR